MKKKEIINNIVTKSGLTKIEVEKIFDSVFEELQLGLKEEGNVVIPSFGTFKTSKRAARKGRNPLTGTELTIPARTAVTFKPSKKLKENFN